ncbi:hypothetical protein EWM64_g1639 [Hericium alpestre]|uniref:Uncharacterized protein n=1 Tax=Hericium alpestre TaxID=135208 RepID=A0A4Z0A7Q3_9AGAM|nr:hypothetical protein EWM64_g1639 [Hericium alpestre]
MSAYGAISHPAASSGPLASTIWKLPAARPGKPASPFGHLTIHHLTLSSAAHLEGLVDFTYRVFAEEVAQGTTYPQEASGGEYTREAFEAYFWAGDVFLAIGGIGDSGHASAEAASHTQTGMEEARAGRTWEECAIGFYYVKPNYPGRSSHICNAGFVVPPLHRQYGYGKTLGRSYLHYAPQLGYKASVFNLVYTSNVGSMSVSVFDSALYFIGKRSCSATH